MLSTVIAVILRIFSNPVANMFQKKLSSSALFTNFYSYLFMSAACLPFVIKVDWSSFSSDFWIYVFIAGFLCSAGTACSIKAIQIGELSVLGPINSYKSVIGLIIAFLFLNEIPSIFGVIGMLLIIYGSRFIFDAAKEGFSLSVLKRKDIRLRFASIIMTGIEAVILKKIILLSSVQISFYMWCFMGCLYSLIFILVSKHKFVPILKKQIPHYVIICFGLATMQLSTNYVFERMNVGYALAFFQLSAIVTLIFGVKFFSEKNFGRKLLGSVIMIIGSILIILFN